MGYRIDRAASIICAVLAHGKISTDKFMPKYEEDDSQAQFASVFAGLKSTAKPKKEVKHG